MSRSPNGAGPPDSLTGPQDAKSNPSNGLVERLREATDGATELQDQHGSVVGYDCHLGNIGDLCDEAADEIERLQKAQQAGVLSIQRGEALESVLAKLGVVETIMVNKGWYRQAVGGYLTDAGLWLDRAMSELRKLVSHAEGENRSANASPSAMPSATTDALSLLLELIPFLSSRGSVTGVRIIVGHEPSERLLSALERLEQDRTSPDRLRLSTGPGDVATGGAAPGDKSAISGPTLHGADTVAERAAAVRELTGEDLAEGLSRLPVLAQLPALILANIEDSPNWRDSWPLLTAHAHAWVLHDDLLRELATPWQPIETAPRDGTSVLLTWPLNPDRAWVGEGWHSEEDGRWYEAGSHPTDATDGEVFPTHWMPLPSPPASPATPIGGPSLGVEGDQGASVAESASTAQAPKSDSDGDH